MSVERKFLGRVPRKEVTSSDELLVFEVTLRWNDVGSSWTRSEEQSWNPHIRQVFFFIFTLKTLF